MKEQPLNLSSGFGGNGAKAFRCLNCNSAVTWSDRMIDVADSKRHTFVNPAGVIYDIYTFSSCPGAVAFTQRTEEFTWFPGYSWSLAVCRSCSAHLGWHYQAVSNSQWGPEFWGILIGQVTE